MKHETNKMIVIFHTNQQLSELHVRQQSPFDFNMVWLLKYTFKDHNLKRGLRKVKSDHSWRKGYNYATG